MTQIASLLTPNTSTVAKPTDGKASIQGMTPEQIDSVATDFEGVFLSLMLKEMRKSLDEGGFFSGESSDTYGGMFDLFIGQHLAESKPLGIGQMLVDQYQKHAGGGPPSDSGDEQSGDKQTGSWSA
ncbi:MAG: rod-binding protein [Planctomycetota bacterium]